MLQLCNLLYYKLYSSLYYRVIQALYYSLVTCNTACIITEYLPRVRMWSSSQSGGGFMNDTQTPSKGSVRVFLLFVFFLTPFLLRSGDKGKKKQNVVPVMVSEVLAAPEEGFTVEGMEVGRTV